MTPAMGRRHGSPRAERGDQKDRAQGQLTPHDHRWAQPVRADAATRNAEWTTLLIRARAHDGYRSIINAPMPDRRSMSGCARGGTVRRGVAR
ncbi:hypothetical protein FNL39_103105 [Nocardia caishijiensis]|uniref:Uncharacterized protein n=1 Tax=Nocardia caishijiensis TaxID=184756 RepID=A0ABQ6YN54_9NOCA|nr:hypothetical protein FNL39_103105 [Nocardia caishijiensis]